MLIRLNVIDRKGKKTAIDIEEGTTIRDAIEEKLSPDNYGNCGGNCACGTCHVHVASIDFEKLKAAEEDEISTLKVEAIKPTTHSRLGCQIELKKEYNDITVTIAPD
jgi:2Fe-2S ferredoxin